MANRRLLLVDDDPHMGVIVDLLLRRAGLTIRCQPSVETAWAAIQEDSPELVLLDVNLPGKSGLELLHRRRAAQGVERFAAALFCQSLLTGDVAAGWRAGADYLLGKELVTDPTAFPQRVGEILEHLHGQAPPRSLGWPGEEESLRCRWGEGVNRALHHPALRSLGAEVHDPMLRRALVFGFGAEARRCWSGPVGQLECRNLPAAAPVEGIHRCLVSLVDQVWCLLGTQACAAFEAALRRV